MASIEVELPARVYRASTHNVKSPDCVEINIDVGFSTIVRRRVGIEGVDRFSIVRELEPEALHCMVALLGGKKLFIQTDEFDAQNLIHARLFIDEREVTPDTPGVMKPYGLNVPMLEVGTFWGYLRNNGFNVRLVHAALDPKRAAKRGNRLPAVTPVPPPAPRSRFNHVEPRTVDKLPPSIPGGTLAERLRDAGRDTVSVGKGS